MAEADRCGTMLGWAKQMTWKGYIRSWNSAEIYEKAFHSVRQPCGG